MECRVGSGNSSEAGIYTAGPPQLLSARHIPRVPTKRSDFHGFLAMRRVFGHYGIAYVDAGTPEAMTAELRAPGDILSF